MLPDWEAEEQADVSVPVIATPVLPARRPWEAGSRLGDPRHTESPEASPRWEPHSVPSSQTAALTPAVSGQHRSGSRGELAGGPAEHTAPSQALPLQHTQEVSAAPVTLLSSRPQAGRAGRGGQDQRTTGQRTPREPRPQTQPWPARGPACSSGSQWHQLPDRGSCRCAATQHQGGPGRWPALPRQGSSSPVPAAPP